MKMSSVHRGSPMPEVHHLRPLMTYSSPSRTIDAWMFVASEEATSGSVIANAERIVPSSNGASQWFFCSAVPYRTSTSMLPVSGNEQLNTSGAIGDRPISSQSGAYSRLVRPGPYSLSGRNRFQSPSFRALAFSSSITGGTVHRDEADSTCCTYTASFGRICASMKDRT